MTWQPIMADLKILEQRQRDVAERLALGPCEGLDLPSEKNTNFVWGKDGRALRERCQLTRTQWAWMLGIDPLRLRDVEAGLNYHGTSWVKTLRLIENADWATRNGHALTLEAAAWVYRLAAAARSPRGEE